MTDLSDFEFIPRRPKKHHRPVPTIRLYKNGQGRIDGIAPDFAGGMVNIALSKDGKLILVKPGIEYRVTNKLTFAATSVAKILTEKGILFPARYVAKRRNELLVGELVGR